jgi:hypothetical protein
MPLASIRAAVAASKPVAGVSTGCGIAHSVTERRSAAMGRAYDRFRVGTEAGAAVRSPPIADGGEPG